MKPIFKYFVIFCLLALVAFLLLSSVYKKQTVEAPAVVETGTVTYTGTVTAVNLEPMTYDGPGLITFSTDKGEVKTVAAASMGRNLCTAKENVTDVYTIKVGDKIEVRGELSSEGQIVPCMGATDYLKVTTPAATQGKLPAGSKPPATKESILGTWVWDKTQMNDDSVITPKKPGVFSITLTADGKISGKTDCNGFFGSYQLGTDGFITFGPLASTMMYCEGSQEAIFMKQINDSNQYLLDPSGNLVLLIKYDSGSILFKK
jgi:heat shock protein HslJ